MTNQALKLSMILRALLLPVARSRPMIYFPIFEGGKIDIEGATQTTITVWFPADALNLSLDDFRDRYLTSTVCPFLARLIEHDAGISHELPLPTERQSAKAVYDGVSMRAVMTPTFSDPILGDVFVPQEDWGKYDPTGYAIRFDVVHSRRPAMAA